MKIRRITLAIGAALILTGCQKADTTGFFPQGLQTYAVTDSLPFSEDWLEAEKKLVVASRGLYLFSLPFMDIVEEHKLPVIIVLFVEDKDKIIQTLQEYQFHYPFIHDPEELLLKNNDLKTKLGITNEENTLFSFFMEGDEVYEPAQIGMRDVLKEQLERFMDK